VIGVARGPARMSTVGPETGWGVWQMPLMAPRAVGLQGSRQAHTVT